MLRTNQQLFKMVKIKPTLTTFPVTMPMRTTSMSARRLSQRNLLIGTRYFYQRNNPGQRLYRRIRYEMEDRLGFSSHHSDFYKDQFAFRAIILTNLIIFFNWNYYPIPFSYKTLKENFICSTKGVFYDHNIFSLIGCTFSHIQFPHLLANMMTFYFFGQEIFLTYGRRFGIGLYLLGGAIASFVQVYQGKQYYQNLQVLGASGAVSSFVVFSILQNPTAVVLIWFVFPVPAALFGIAYILQDFYGLSHRQQYHGALIGHEAHLAGSFVGALAFLAKRRYWI
jgi:membrane associated rhomboid family serine protease